jgi:hypothetical protein
MPFRANTKLRVSLEMWPSDDKIGMNQEFPARGIATMPPLRRVNSTRANPAFADHLCESPGAEICGSI